MSKQDRPMTNQEFENHMTQKRNQVLEIELNVRWQKASYETMYYSLESEKIKQSYLELTAKQMEATQKIKNMAEDLQNKLKEQVEGVDLNTSNTSSGNVE